MAFTSHDKWIVLKSRWYGRGLAKFVGHTLCSAIAEEGNLWVMNEKFDFI
jgi:hypothetical protein